VLNNSRWWNTGSVVMLWSGANKDAAGAVNTTADQAMTAGKWSLWLGYNQVGATGMQGTVLGSRSWTITIP